MLYAEPLSLLPCRQQHARLPVRVRHVDGVDLQRRAMLGRLVPSRKCNRSQHHMELVCSTALVPRL